MNNPLVLLSPSKGMRTESKNFHGVDAVPLAFPELTKAIVEHIQALSEQEQQKLFKVSDAMFPDVQALWQGDTNDFIDPSDGIPGLYAYTGEAYKFLAAEHLSLPAAKRAENSLAILSALYGVVRPGMHIIPYRLEMQGKLGVGAYKSLHALWKQLITDYLNELSVPFIVDAMSSEYRKAVQWNSINIPVVHVDFQQLRGGKISSISAFGKQARGTFARWVMEENVQTILGLASFNLDGYSLAVHQDDKMIFLREEQ
ncbi:MAG: hypothetical protein RL754_84 [Bacteroidota bacterium]|jgi:cytoplasmic iron level regulating protein YaaA (DUF328/UPF0246 family)